MSQFQNEEWRVKCPTADVVFDKFHVLAKMSEAMDAIRRSEYRSDSSKG